MVVRSVCFFSLFLQVFLYLLLVCMTHERTIVRHRQRFMLEIVNIWLAAGIWPAHKSPVPIMFTFLNFPIFEWLVCKWMHILHNNCIA